MIILSACTFLQSHNICVKRLLFSLCCSYLSYTTSTSCARHVDQAYNVLLCYVYINLYTACMHLNGVRWWGGQIRVTSSKAKRVNMAKEGIEVSHLISQSLVMIISNSSNNFLIQS